MLLNQSHAEHFGITLLIQFGAALPAALLIFFLAPAMAPIFIPVALTVTGAGAVGLFLGREINQHSYKLAIQRGWEWGQVRPVAWYEGFTTGWKADSILDVVASVVACLLGVGLACWVLSFI